MAQSSTATTAPYFATSTAHTSLVVRNSELPHHTPNNISTAKDLPTKLRYLKHLGKQCFAKNIVDRIDTLANQPLLTAFDFMEIDSLDQDITSAMLAAEQASCRPKHEWSPTLKLHQKLVKAWRLIVSANRIPRDITAALTNIKADITTISNNLNIDTTNLKVYDFNDTSYPHVQLRMAKRALSSVKRKDTEHRRQHLVQRQLHYLTNDEPKMAKALKRMLAAEDKKRIFKTIKMYVHPKGDGNLN